MKYIKQFSIIITVSFWERCCMHCFRFDSGQHLQWLLMLAGLCCHIIPMDEG